MICLRDGHSDRQNTQTKHIVNMSTACHKTKEELHGPKPKAIDSIFVSREKEQLVQNAEIRIAAFVAWGLSSPGKQVGRSSTLSEKEPSLG